MATMEEMGQSSRRAALAVLTTGIVGETVVTMGLLSLPAMLKAGYDPKLACGTICASGTLGQIIPPSIVLVILGDILQGANTQAQLAKGNFAPGRCRWSTCSRALSCPGCSWSASI